MPAAQRPRGLSVATLVVPVVLVIPACETALLPGRNQIHTGAAKIGAIRANAAEIARGCKFELTFDLRATFDNPFDPDDVDIRCEFATPDGRSVVVPAFHYTPFGRGPDGTLGAAGQAVWKVRFTPRDAGVYRYRVTGRDRNGRAQSRAGRMRCTPGNYDGFVRVSRESPTAFEFDSGRAYYPVGFNLLSTRWAPPDAPIPPERLSGMCDYLNRLADAGGNFVRLRADSYYNPIEATANEASGFRGAGWYHPRASFEIDELYSLAEHRGVHIMHCLYNANSLVGGHTRREKNRRFAFNLKENGGPCETTDDFWTNEEMLALVRRKLRYSVARWGYSRSLMCWELFNEVGKLDEKRRIEWHRDMSRYLRSVDPYDHPVSTSTHYGKMKAYGFWDMPEMDFVQTHIYGKQNLAEHMAALSKEITGRHGKPVLFGEFGLHAQIREWNDADREGVGMHNAIWSTAMAGGSGVADWFIRAVAKYDLFRHYRTFSDWARDVPWNHPKTRPLEAKVVVPGEAPRQGDYSDMLITPGAREQFTKARKERFTVDPGTRKVANVEHLQAYLHGMPSRKTRPTFVLDCGEPAQFQVSVSTSVGDAANALRIYLDGALAAERPFPAAEGKGVRDATYVARYDNWTCYYDETVTVDVPAGRHEVMVEALAKDRLEVAYRLNNYFTGGDPARVTGRQTADAAWFWVQNEVSTTTNARLGIEPRPVRKMRASLGGLADGEYEIKWWDTWKGRPAGTARARSSRGELVVEIPTFVRDVAGKARRTK